NSSAPPRSASPAPTLSPHWRWWSSRTSSSTPSLPCWAWCFSRASISGHNRCASDRCRTPRSPSRQRDVVNVVNTRPLRFFAPFVLSLALVILVVRQVQSEASQVTGSELSSQLMTVFANASWWLVAPGIALYFVGVWIRSIRWGMLLPEYNVPTPILFQALVVGFT